MQLVRDVRMEGQQLILCGSESPLSPLAELAHVAVNALSTLPPPPSPAHASPSLRPSTSSTCPRYQAACETARAAPEKELCPASPPAASCPRLCLQKKRPLPHHPACARGVPAALTSLPAQHSRSDGPRPCAWAPDRREPFLLVPWTGRCSSRQSYASAAQWIVGLLSTAPFGSSFRRTRSVGKWRHAQWHAGGRTTHTHTLPAYDDPWSWPLIA